MFDKALPPLPENPFKSLNGIYKVPINLTVDELLEPLRYGLTYSSQSVFQELKKVVKLYKNKAPKASLSSVLKVLNVPDSDLAKLPSMTGDINFEYWEITTDPKDIEKMGKSKHFTSCYAGGVQPNYILEQAEHKGLALVRRLDKDGDLRERFLISADIDVGEQRFKIEGRIRASNFKGSVGYAPPRVIKCCEALMAGKAVKLEGEELKNFQWT